MSANEVLPAKALAGSTSPASRRTIERVGASVMATIGRSGAAFLTTVLIARTLGPKSFGDLTFLLGSFAAVALLLDSGTSTGFFTLASMRPRGRRFFATYGLWTFGVQLFGTLAVLALLPTKALLKAWQGQPRAIVILAFIAAFLSTQGWNSVVQLGESQRRTFRVQLASAAQAFVHLALIVVAASASWLTVTAVLMLLIVEYCILNVIIAPPLVQMTVKRATDDETWRGVVRDFVVYCRPVAVYSYVGFLYMFADRWLLQRFGGAEQQGIFGFAQQFGAISILATAAIMNVFWKEIAEARAQENLIRLRELYIRSRRALFFTAAFVSCLLVPWSDRLVVLAAGSSYAAGASVLTLMLLYPVHQSLGQLQGTFLVATGDTRTYATLGLVMMIASIAAAYVLLASPAAAVPGLGLGARGLAAKLVGLQIVQVIVASVLISRKYKLPRDLLHEFSLIASLLALSFGIRWAMDLVSARWASVTQIAVATLVYSAITLTAVWFHPDVVGLDQGVIREVVRRIRESVRAALHGFPSLR